MANASGATVANSPTTLCVVMPALNEEATIADVIRQVPEDIHGVSEVIIIVVDDGSTDGTRLAALSAGAQVVSHPDNRGLGAAFHTGVRKAIELGADYLVNIDSDGQFNPEDIPKLLQPLMDARADCVTASRFIHKDYYPDMGAVRFYGNRMMSALISFLSGKKYYDVSCGFRAYTRDTLLQLNLFGEFTYTQETFLDLTFKGLRILEVPIKTRGERPVGRSRVASNILRYAYNTGKIILRTFRDYYPLRVFGFVAAILLAGATALSCFLLIHYARTGGFTPHKWAGLTGGFLAGAGFMILVAGFIADMLVRIRINQERILYMLRKRGR